MRKWQLGILCEDVLQILKEVSWLRDRVAKMDQALGFAWLQ